MKIKEIIEVKDIEGFAKALDSCEGKIELLTNEGDVLNLRSQFSRLMSLNVILCQDMILSGISLGFELQQDMDELSKYIRLG